MTTDEIIHTIENELPGSEWRVRRPNGRESRYLATIKFQGAEFNVSHCSPAQALEEAFDQARGENLYAF